LQKNCAVLQEKRFRAPAPPLLVAVSVAVAARGHHATGLAAGVAAGGAALAVVAARGPTCPGLAAGAVMAIADAAAAALGGPSGGSVGVLLSWEAGDCSCLVSKQENKAVPI
jgi:hypothetical protein